MLIKLPKIWELPDFLATSEEVFLNRRQLLTSAGIGAAALSVAGCNMGNSPENSAEGNLTIDPTGDLYPATRNEVFKIERPITPEFLNAKYNNFYEFGSHKQIANKAQRMQIRPWEVQIDGLVETPKILGVDDLIRAMPLEERLYRLRCVEAWSMTIPWSGFALSKLVELAKPLSSAKYLRMETFNNAEFAPGQRADWYPWPYVEGMTMAEATNDLAFLVTGAYGKPLAKQFGAPLRLALPWKYGFKSIKSIVRFEFTAVRPISFWEEIQSAEYGFWANVNPAVPHPRWSQAMERDLETGELLPTRLFNGYGEQVAGLYQGMEREQLYI
jgi:sulfoxide reductase catalytic subunit YedY